jgi:uncharacterized protein
MAAPFTPTQKTRIKRIHERGRYDRDTVYAILDAGVICHVGYVIDDHPYVTPTSYWRHGDRLYWHGSSASRMLRHLKQEVPVCVEVTHFDGFVLARSGFHHSINYRSVMAFGHAQLVPEDEKLAALEDFVERLFPGRWAELRPPTRQEIKATTVLHMALDEVSAKVRTVRRRTTRKTMRFRSGPACCRSPRWWRRPNPIPASVPERPCRGI